MLQVVVVVEVVVAVVVEGMDGAEHSTLLQVMRPLSWWNARGGGVVVVVVVLTAVVVVLVVEVEVVVVVGVTSPALRPHGFPGWDALKVRLWLRRRSSRRAAGKQ